MTKKLISILLLAGFISAQAAVVTENGADVSFTYDNATLYGPGTIVGNSIFFSPANFRADSFNTEVFDDTVQILSIVVDVLAGSSGFEVTDIAMQEQGDYRLIGDASTVSATGSLTVTSNTTNCGGSACTEFQGFSAGALTVKDAFTEWSASTLIGLSDNATWLSDTSITVDIENILTATSTVQNESAEIQKKNAAVGIDLNPTLSVVPVPAAAWLFGSALGLLGWMRKRQIR